MKVLAVIALLAVVAYASEDATTAAPVTSTANADEFVGELQDTANGPIVEFGPTSPQQGPPSCKLGKTLGNPICFAKCISRNHKGGYCDGKKCTCVD